MHKEYLSSSVEDTRELARQFACSLRPGDVVCLNGDLGAGKTEFMRGIAQVFNCEAQLSSPTFSLFNIYEGSFSSQPVELHHFDLYRIASPAELDAIGFYEYLCGPFISIVEWGDKFPEAFPPETGNVFIESAGENQRRIVIDTRA